MFILFAVLLPMLVLAFIAGLIKPSLVIYWGNRTRKQVLLIYGAGILIAFILLGVFMPPDKEGVTNEKATVSNTWKSGSISYAVECTGSNSKGVDLFKAYSPTAIDLFFTGDTLVLEEKEGTAGFIFADSLYKRVYFLDTITKTKTRGKGVSMETEFQDEKTQKAMPAYYRAELKETSEKATICGHSCTKFNVEKSGFVRAYAKAEVWISDEVLLPQLRFDFQTEGKRILTPLPLQIGIDKGTILKMVVNEDNVIVTYTVTAVSSEKPAAPIVSLPF